MYKSRLDEKLAEISVPFEAILCGEIHCNEHHNDITNFHNSIIDACLLADTCIPRAGDNLSGRKVIPGWNEYVKEHRDMSMFWHSIWKSCDSPRHGIIADIRRQTRARYHSALRKVKTSSDNISANRLAEGLLADNKRDFWNEVKRIKGGSIQLPTVVDNSHGPENISTLFENRELYQSVSYDSGQMDDLKDEIQTLAQEHCANDCRCINSHTVSVEDVTKHVITLKRGKHDGKDEIYSDHILHGTQ